MALLYSKEPITSEKRAARTRNYTEEIGVNANAVRLHKTETRQKFTATNAGERQPVCKLKHGDTNKAKSKQTDAESVL